MANKTERVTFKTNKKLLDNLKSVADSKNTTISVIIRCAIIEYLIAHTNYNITYEDM